MIRREISLHGGREAEHGGSGFIVSFTSAIQAVSCAIAIQKNMTVPEKKLSALHIGLDAGEPIEKSNKVFGDTIQLATHLCAVLHQPGQIVLSNAVKDLLTTDQVRKSRSHLVSLLPTDEGFLETLFSKLEKKWQDPDFTVAAFCKAMSMSTSQLYRKTTTLWDLSPNQLLKEYRLNKARELLRKHRKNVSQATFDSGFTSPSYFTKCFKRSLACSPRVTWLRLPDFTQWLKFTIH